MSSNISICPAYGESLSSQDILAPVVETSTPEDNCPHLLLCREYARPRHDVSLAKFLSLYHAIIHYYSLSVSQLTRLIYFSYTCFDFLCHPITYDLTKGVHGGITCGTGDAHFSWKYDIAFPSWVRTLFLLSLYFQFCLCCICLVH